MFSGEYRPPFIGVVGEFLLAFVLVEHLDGAASHGYGDDTDLDVLGQCGDHGAAEVVAHAEFPDGADDRAVGDVLVAEHAGGAGEIGGGEHPEAAVHAFVAGLPLGIALHVGLSEAEVDVEVGVGFLGAGGCQPQGEHCK